MGSPDDRRYSRTHEWHLPEGNVVTIGISKFAVDELTDITYLDISRKSGPIQAGQSFGEIESVKATSELYSGIDGTIVAINQEALANPELINDDPYGKGWLIKIEPGNPAQLDALMDADRYDQQNG
jgi:glycine cleavage system H protein